MIFVADNLDTLLQEQRAIFVMLIRAHAELAERRNQSDWWEPPRLANQKSKSKEITKNHR